jgi:DoxX-like protein
MHVAVVALSVLLAVLMAASAAPKILDSQSAQRNQSHLGISRALSRRIGVSELAATAGFLVGLRWHPLTTITAAAVVLLMIGASTYHVRARDNVVAMLPAISTLSISAALIALSFLT